MNENILSDVTSIAGNISPLSVVVLLFITIIGTVLMIAFCNGGLAAVKILWDRLFRHKE